MSSDKETKNKNCVQIKLVKHCWNKLVKTIANAQEISSYIQENLQRINKQNGTVYKGLSHMKNHNKQNSLRPALSQHHLFKYNQVSSLLKCIPLFLLLILAFFHLFGVSFPGIMSPGSSILDLFCKFYSRC